MKLVSSITASAALSLGACSYVFEVTVLSNDGQISFAAGDSSWDDPDCAKQVEVRDMSNESVVVWSIKSPAGECTIPFPIRYGAMPDGVSVETPSSALKLGHEYSVQIVAEGSGYGGAEFVFSGE